MRIMSGSRYVAVVLCALATIVFAGCGGTAKGDNADPPTRAEAVEAISAFYMHEYADNSAYNRGEQRAWNVRVDNVDVVPAPVQATRFGDAWPVVAGKWT
jgi:hypothetical protein